MLNEPFIYKSDCLSVNQTIIMSVKSEILPDYISRTQKDMDLTCSDMCQIAVILETAFIKCKKDVSSSDYYKLYGCALLVSMKMSDDDVYDNNYFAKHLKITLDALNISEIIFLKILNWNAFVSVEKYDKKVLQLENFGNDCTKLIVSIFYPNLFKFPIEQIPKRIFQDGYKQNHTQVLYCPLPPDHVIKEEQSILSFFESLLFLFFSVD